MSDISENPYIFFQGNCREAMNFYKDIFGGELSVQTYEDVGAVSAENPADYLMHARLTGGEIVLMGSDTAGASSTAAKLPFH